MKEMQYRKLPHGEEQISILGLGTSSIQAADEMEIEDTIHYAMELEKIEEHNFYPSFLQYALHRRYCREDDI